MKKFAKVMLIIAAVFASLGIGLAAGGAVMGANVDDVDVFYEVGKHIRDAFDINYSTDTKVLDLDDYKVNNSQTAKSSNTDESRVYRIGEKKNLDIELKYDELILEEYAGAGILVEVKNDPKGNVQVKEDGDTLEITSSRKLATNRQVKISCPANMKFDEVEIAVGAGNVEMRSNVTAEKLDINIGAGEFVNKGTITVTETDLEVGAGSLDIVGLSTEYIDGECGIGEMSLEINGKEQDYSYSLECGIGEINLGADSYSGLGKEKSINNPGAKGAIDLECGIGEIAVSFTE